MSSMLDLDPKRTLAMRAAKTMIAMALVGAIITTVSWHYTGGVSLQKWYAVLLANLVLAIVISFYSKMPGWVSNILFYSSVVAVFIANTLTNVELVQGGSNFEAFVAYKLIAIGIAIISPNPIWLATLVIALCGIVPTVFYFYLPPEWRTSFAVQEPWLSIVYACMAWLLLLHNLANRKSTQKVMQLESQRKSLEELAGIFLAMRDLTNSSLQTIEYVTELAKHEKLSAKELSAYLEKSMQRYRDVSQALALSDDDVNWLKSHAAMDSADELRRKLKSSIESLKENTKPIP